MALLPTKKIQDVSKATIDIKQLTVYENSISGDAIHGGLITGFNSTGIKDQSDSLQITVDNDTVEVKNDLVVKGTVTVENLKYVEAQVPKLNVTEAIMIDHNEVIWKGELGRSVKKSNIEQLGSLRELQVKNTMWAKEGRVGINTQAPSADFSVNVEGYEVVTKMQEKNAYVGTHSPVPFAIGTDDTPRIKCKSNGDIVLGNEEGAPIKVSVTGRLGIGIKNPSESLHVVGNIRFAERIFASGTGSPVEGRWETGSIVWNDKPDTNQPVGWVCSKGGTPGHWQPFGIIF
jgi:hypothetical protein